MIYEIAEAIAPTWEAPSPQIEQVIAPVREWLVRELAPGEADTCSSSPRASATPASMPPS